MRTQTYINFSIFLTLLVSSACRHTRTNHAQQPDFETRKITHQNRAREYLLYTPPSYNPKSPAPLVLAFHGGSTSHERIARTTLFHKLADDHGFLVAYPNGVDGHWNDGRASSNPKIDDVGFVRLILDEVKRTRSLDTARIYATGISNGSFMTQRLACELSDRFAAVSVVAGSMSAELNAVCKPKRPMPIMFINSPEDKFVLWQGGEMKRGKGGKMLSVADSVAFWTNHNGCKLEKGKSFPKKIPQDQTNVKLKEFSNCQNNTLVLQFIVEGGGHTWPSGKDQPAWLVGPTTQHLDATLASWDFFEKFKLTE
ncbi:MAG: hydrolase [Betaproteobacteria bacterium]|nr:hydrolase [Betaproteobacteria bacterium]